jgi:hypothetical protein
MTAKSAFPESSTQSLPADQLLHSKAHRWTRHNPFSPRVLLTPCPCLLPKATCNRGDKLGAEWLLKTTALSPFHSFSGLWICGPGSNPASATKPGFTPCVGLSVLICKMGMMLQPALSCCCESSENPGGGLEGCLVHGDNTSVGCNGESIPQLYELLLRGPESVSRVTTADPCALRMPGHLCWLLTPRLRPPTSLDCLTSPSVLLLCAMQECCPSKQHTCTT